MSRPSFSPVWKIPMAHKPHQGGQQHFQHHLLRRANELAAGTGVGKVAVEAASAAPRAGMLSLLPQAEAGRLPTQHLEAPPLDDDAVSTARGFNELALVDALQQGQPHAAPDDGTGAGSKTAKHAVGDDFFRNRFGYSLLKDGSGVGTGPSVPAEDADYSEVDLWAELPKYGKQTYFLYLINRRRNAYAVMYAHDGTRMLPTYSVGNRGLKKGDKGFRAEGSAENAHQITSQYLADVLPKCREREMNAKRMKPGDNKKLDVVVRVMGFYNGRQGGIRAVQDKAEEFNVRLLEDITPFPLNGPRLPRLTYRA